MGLSPSKLTPDFARSLTQETSYITFAGQFGKEFAANVALKFGESKTIEDAGANSRLRLTHLGDFPIAAIKPTYLISACAYQGRDDIDNILDGFSTALLVKVMNNSETGEMVIKFAQKPIEDSMFQRELNPVPKRPNTDSSCWCCTKEYNPTGMPPLEGVTKKDMSCWNCGLWPGLFNGKVSLWDVLRPSAMADRTTAHQPIYTQGNIYLCAVSSWQQISVAEDPKTGLLAIQQIDESPKTSPLLKELPDDWPRNKKEFFCMHSHEDINYVNSNGEHDPRMLSYTFTHSKIKPLTYITFYEFGLEKPLQGNTSKKAKKITYFKVDHYAQLHQFGYTKNYYLIFANKFAIDKCSMICCGVPVLRALDDNFECNLVIYLVRRPDAPTFLPQFMAVDTRQLGNIYHTVNCFEEYNHSDEELNSLFEKYYPGQSSKWTPAQRKYFMQTFPTKIVLDGWTSQLNAARESSQFELKQDAGHSVYDNEGCLYRYSMYLNRDFQVQACYNQMVANEIDSSIDFHCINPHNYGRRYRNFWLVAHHRERPVSALNPEGNIEHVHSTLYGITMPASELDRHNSNVESVKPNDLPPAPVQWHTKDHLPEHDAYGRRISYYMRTPMFVARDSIDSLQKNAAGKSASELRAEKDKKERDGYLFTWVYRLVHEAHVAAATNPDQIAEADKVLQRPPNYGDDKNMYVIDENLIKPYLIKTATQPKGNKPAPLKSLVSSGKHKEDGSANNITKSAVILLIFDALSFNEKSKPYIIEFDEILPYSVHSWTHQLAAQAAQAATGSVISPSDVKVSAPAVSPSAESAPAAAAKAKKEEEAKQEEPAAPAASESAPLVENAA